MNPASLIAGIPWDFETFPEYLGSIERHGTMLNFAAYIGHTPLRLYVMGDRGRRAARPSPTRSSKMAALVRRGDGRRRRRVRHQLRRHPPRGRRSAHPQPVGRPRRDRRRCAGRSARPGRGVVGVNGGRRPQLPRQPTSCSRTRPSRSPTPPCSPPPTAPTSRPWRSTEPACARGAKVWPAGVVPPADVLHDDGRAVHAQHQPGVRRADAADRSTQRRAAYADPAWRRRVRERVGTPGRASRRAGTPTRSWSRRRTPS